MEWIKTTFGELKEGDYFVTQPLSKSGDFTSLCIAKHGKWPKDLEVYRLVSPEREALRLVVEGYEKAPDEDFDWVSWYAIAKEALEGK